MILQYKSSKGLVFDLKVGAIRTRTANFHDYEWIPLEHTQKLGSKVYDFRREPVVYTATMTMTGTLEKRKQTLNLLHAAFDADVFNKTPGQIWHGKYYIDCYATFSSTGYDAPWTNNTVNFYCPYPFWMCDHTWTGTATETESYEYLDYDYDYNYDVLYSSAGYRRIDNPGEGAAEFTLTMHGAAQNPAVVIDGVSIGVNATILADEYVVIDSKNKTVMKYTDDGTYSENIFNRRFKEVSIFERISAGHHNFVWPGTFDFKFVLHEERSEPLWI